MSSRSAPPPVAPAEVPSPPSTRGEATTVRWIMVLGACFVALLGVKAWALEPVRVGSDSMEPGLKAGQFVLADKLSFRFGSPSPGDVVLAREPGSGQLVVKRVVAVGGDSVGIEDGVLIRNGTIVSEDYTNQSDMSGFYFGPDPVPAGHVFLLGDNRFTSSDSRGYGPVPFSELEGRVLFQS
ncbi:MAG: signal peptidase I [Acidimicrobiales bacterium]